MLSFCAGVSLGVWFGFVRSALLLAVGTCVVLSFEAMPGLCCFLRVTFLRGYGYRGSTMYGVFPCSYAGAAAVVCFTSPVRN